MKITFQPRVIDILAALFILLFLYTALSKSLEYVAFRNTIKLFPLLKSYANPVANFIIVTEYFACLLLIIPRCRLWGLYVSLALMTIFTLYISYALITGRDLPCTCGGVLQQMTWSQHLLFNLFFMVAAISGIILIRKPQLLISRRSRKPVKQSRQYLSTLILLL